MDPLCCGDVTGGSPPGSAGVPPAQHWHSFTHLFHPARPAMAPGLCFSRARAVPAGRVAGCPIAGKLSGHPTQSMRARRPRSRVGASPVAPRGPLLFLLFQVNSAPAPHDGADHAREKHPIVNNDEPRMNTNRHEDRWTCLAATTSRDAGHPGARASRPHNTGTASPIASTRLDRQWRHDSASAEPMGFPPAGWPGAASREN